MILLLLKLINKILIFYVNLLKNIQKLKGVYSIIGLLKQLIAYNDKKIHILKLKNFYNNIFNKPKLIFDIGCNIGDYTKTFLKFSDFVVAVDPNIEVINQLRNSTVDFISKKKLKILNIAISNQIGEAKLYINSSRTVSSINKKWQKRALPEMFPHVHNVDTEIVKSTTLDNLIKEFGIPDYIKLDIEGGELNAFIGLNQPINILSFETTLPIFHDETIKILHKISSLGEYQFKLLVYGEYQFLDTTFSKDQIIKSIISKQLKGVVDIFCFKKGNNYVSNLINS